MSPTEQLWQQFAAAGPDRKPQIRKQLMEANLELVQHIARRYCLRRNLRTEEYDDMVQSGVFGLADAIDAFDPNRGIKFPTYASRRILGSMLDAARDWDWVPRRVRTLGQTAVQVFGLFEEQTYHHNGRDIPSAFADFVQAPESLDPTRKAQSADWVAWLLAGLSAAEKLILRLYALEGFTMKEAGKVVGLSESRVSQILSLLREQLAAKLNQLKDSHEDRDQ